MDLPRRWRIPHRMTCRPSARPRAPHRCRFDMFRIGIGPSRRITAGSGSLIELTTLKPSITITPSLDGPRSLTQPRLGGPRTRRRTDGGVHLPTLACRALTLPIDAEDVRFRAARTISASMLTTAAALLTTAPSSWSARLFCGRRFLRRAIRQTNATTRPEVFARGRRRRSALHRPRAPAAACDKCVRLSIVELCMNGEAVRLRETVNAYEAAQ